MGYQGTAGTMGLCSSQECKPEWPGYWGGQWDCAN